MSSDKTKEVKIVAFCQWGYNFSKYVLYDISRILNEILLSILILTHYYP